MPWKIVSYRTFVDDIDRMIIYISTISRRRVAHRFPGTDDRDQILRIFEGLGTPTPASWPGAQQLAGRYREMRCAVRGPSAVACVCMDEPPLCCAANDRREPPPDVIPWTGVDEDTDPDEVGHAAAMQCFMKE